MTTDLDRIDAFCDAVPRGTARVEEYGPILLFVRDGEGWPFYARPRPGADEPPTADHVDRVRARQRELGVPESFEWIAETAPALRAAVEKSGLAVRDHPLMVLGTFTPPPGPPADGVDVRVLGPDDRALPTTLTVPHLAFAAPGTGVGEAGPAELAAAARVHATPAALARAITRMAHGESAWAAAVDDTTAAAVCSGQFNRVDDVCEIVAVGTLPSARRRGLALSVTAALVAEAHARGVGTLFLAAGDADVARIYARLGFRRVGTAVIAGPEE